VFAQAKIKEPEIIKGMKTSLSKIYSIIQFYTFEKNSFEKVRNIFFPPRYPTIPLFYAIYYSLRIQEGREARKPCRPFPSSIGPASASPCSRSRRCGLLFAALISRGLSSGCLPGAP
jgi:hypothetical protein